MAVTTLNVTRANGESVTEAIQSTGTDIQVRINKTGEGSVIVESSIDGEEGYTPVASFGLGETACEQPIASPVKGVFLRFRSQAEITSAKILISE